MVWNKGGGVMIIKAYQHHTGGGGGTVPTTAVQSDHLNTQQLQQQGPQQYRISRVTSSLTAGTLQQHSIQDAAGSTETGMPTALQMEHQQHSIQNASSTETGMLTEQQMDPPAAWHSG
jgi:hypothetical protein